VARGSGVAPGAGRTPYLRLEWRRVARGDRSRRFAISERAGVAIGLTALLILAATQVVTLVLIFVNGK
jgi:hypothetical protein